MPASWLSVKSVYRLITIRYVDIAGYEEIDESEMDDIQSEPQKACQDRMIAPSSTASPSPPPPRPGTSISPMKLDTLNFANKVDADELSGYEYVSNPMKQTSIISVKRKIFSGEIHDNHHSDKNGNDEDGAVDAERVNDHDGGKQLDVCSVNEKMGGRSRSKSNACLFDMQRSKAKVPCKSAYQKLVRETMSSTHAPHNYQKLIKETIEPHAPCSQSNIPDLKLQQRMAHPDRKNQDRCGYQKLIKEAICNGHEYQKLDRQTMEPSGYILSAKCKHATI